MISERFNVGAPETYSERFNMAPTQGTLIVREQDAGFEAVMARWGPLPHWAKDERVAFKMVNARAETLPEKPAYRALLGKHRCLIPADGFYEWRLGADGKKEPVYFQLMGGELFAFAGLWTSRRDDETGETLDSCTIVTTRPNELVAQVHDRMPVILPRELEHVWLDPELPRDHALEFLQPYDPAGMTAAVASRLVNSVKNEGPELLRADNALRSAAERRPPKPASVGSERPRRSKHATVPGKRLQHLAAPLAAVKELAGVLLHGFSGRVAHLGQVIVASVMISTTPGQATSGLTEWHPRRTKPGARKPARVPRRDHKRT